MSGLLACSSYRVRIKFPCEELKIKFSWGLVFVVLFLSFSCLRVPCIVYEWLGLTQALSVLWESFPLLSIKPQRSNSAVLFCTLDHSASPTHVTSHDNTGEKTDSPSLKKSRAFYFLFLPLTVQAEEMGQETKCNSLQEWQKIPDRRKVRQEAKHSGSSFLGEMQSYSCFSRRKDLRESRCSFPYQMYCLSYWWSIQESVDIPVFWSFVVHFSFLCSCSKNRKCAKAALRQ